MALYDCFLYNGEEELLDIRLNVLGPGVDRFVVVESDRTFTGQPKPLRFLARQAAFKRFLPRITYVVTTSPYTEPWDNEYFARYRMLEGLKACRSDDVILVCDVDEVPDLAKVQAYRDEPGIKVLLMPEHYYYLNCRSEVVCNATRMLSYADLLLCGGPQVVRRLSQGLKVVPDAGHHWSYLMSPEKIREKLEAFSHAEYNDERYKGLDHITRAMEAGVDLFDRPTGYRFVPLDASYPAYVREHQARFQHLIKALP